MSVDLQFTMSDANAQRVLAAYLWKYPKPSGETMSDPAWVKAKIRGEIVKLVFQHERHQAYLALDVVEDPTVVT